MRSAPWVLKKQREQRRAQEDGKGERTNLSWEEPEMRAEQTNGNLPHLPYLPYLPWSQMIGKRRSEVGCGSATDYEKVSSERQLHAKR